MASPICTLSFCCSSSSYVRNSSKSSMFSLAPCSCSSSSSMHTRLKTLEFPLFSRFSQMGLCQFTPWNGLRHMGISLSPIPQKTGGRDKCKGKGVYASLFGVGAPEALVIGAVALLVFGPKGLAEVARNLGKTLREFQPTIRELQEVSREFKSNLEREISLDNDLGSVGDTYGSRRPNTANRSVSNMEDSQTVSVADPNDTPSNNAYSSEEYLKITEEQLKASAAAQQDVASLPPENQVEIGSQSQDSDPPNAEDYLKVIREHIEASLSPESQIEVESQPQGAIQETVAAAPPIPEAETET